LGRWDKAGRRLIYKREKGGRGEEMEKKERGDGGGVILKRA
jgi:hypothetical protein